MKYCSMNPRNGDPVLKPAESRGRQLKKNRSRLPVQFTRLRSRLTGNPWIAVGFLGSRLAHGQGRGLLPEDRVLKIKQEKDKIKQEKDARLGRIKRSLRDDILAKRGFIEKVRSSIGALLFRSGWVPS
jgi:hypothetical protein